MGVKTRAAHGYRKITSIKEPNIKEPKRIIGCGILVAL